MPLDADIDRTRMLVAGASGVISAFFHWAAIQTSEQNPSPPKLRGQMIASFASGALTAWALGIQTAVHVDILGVFVAASVVGFTYGPAGLIMAARFATQKLNLEEAKPQDFETKVERLEIPTLRGTTPSPAPEPAPVSTTPLTFDPISTSSTPSGGAQ